MKDSDRNKGGLEGSVFCEGQIGLGRKQVDVVYRESGSSGRVVVSQRGDVMKIVSWRV